MFRLCCPSFSWVRASILVFLLWGGSGQSLPLALGQSQVQLADARTYAQSLDRNFWEQRWSQHLDEQTDDDGSIEWHYEDRRQLNKLTDDYQQAIRQGNGFWTNPQVEDYLQRQLLAVQPNPMMPGRPGAFRIRVLSTTTPNALALNDGTLLLTTGLITTLETEAQLRAVLAHEVAHIVLDHALSTYRSGKRRSKARKVFGTLVEGVTSVVTPGLGGSAPLESTVYGLSSDLATRYLDREFIASAGLEYTKGQEAAAHRLTQQWLLARDEPDTALYEALQILARSSKTASTVDGAAFTDSHPIHSDLRSELAAVFDTHGSDPTVLADSSRPPDPAYDTAIAAVLEHEAEMDLAARQFHSAGTVLDRALQTDWTTPRTFLFKAIAVRNTTSSTASIDEALALLDEAERAANAPEPRIEAERALLRIRQDNAAQARRHLARYRDQIEQLRARSAPPDSLAAPHNDLYNWTAQMDARLRE